jgi:hypothetical protein
VKVELPDLVGFDALLGLILTDLRLLTVKRIAVDLCAQSDREGWPGHRLLEVLLAHTSIGAHPDIHAHAFSDACDIKPTHSRCGSHTTVLLARYCAARCKLATS